MPAVTDDTDILEHTTPATASACADTASLPLLLPSARRGGFPLLARLRSLLTAGSTRLARMQQYPSQGRGFELPIDLLARTYPDIHLRTMSGTG